MIVVLMGVTASGKSTIGELAAEKTGWQFAEGDSFHSQANRDKMHRGIPLNDEDRAPWLASLHELLLGWDRSRTSGILACSALKQKYRDELARDIPPERLRFAFLDVPRQELEKRLRERKGHYMNPSLLESQIETLEIPSDAIHLDGTKPPDETVRRILDELGIGNAAGARS